MTEREITLISDKTPVKDMTLAALREQLAVYRKYKMWGAARYYTLDHEVQQRATWEWVKQDVFGHTFDGLQ